MIYYPRLEINHISRDGTARPWISGVCADYAARTNTPVMLWRVAAIGLFVWHPWPAGLVYVAFSIRHEKRTRRWQRRFFDRTDGPDGAGYDPFRPPPGFEARAARFAKLRSVFIMLEERLARLESEVTSSEFDLRRRFRDLDR